jgi:hypothetical protein
LVERVRVLCFAVTEAFERETWDGINPTFRVGTGRGRIFCTAGPDGSTITLKAHPVEREILLAQGDLFSSLRTLETRAGWPSAPITREPTGRRWRS